MAGKEEQAPSGGEAKWEPEKEVMSAVWSVLFFGRERSRLSREEHISFPGCVRFDHSFRTCGAFLR